MVEVRGTGEAVLRQADQLRAAQELVARPREAVFRVHGAGTRGRLRHRLAGAHVDLLARRRRSSTRRSCSATSRHWNKVLDQDLLKPIADEIAQKADVMLIGYAGGGVRNIFSNKPATTLAELKGLKVRVQGAPIWSRTFAGDRHVADGDRLQRGLQRHPERRHRRRRERGRRRRADEVLRGRPEPHHDRARHHHPAARASRRRRSRRCRPSCRRRCVKAGKEAGAHGRQIESSEDTAKLDALEKAGKLKRIPFTDRAEMKKLVDPGAWPPTPRRSGPRRSWRRSTPSLSDAAGVRTRPSGRAKRGRIPTRRSSVPDRFRRPGRSQLTQPERPLPPSRSRS